MFLSGLCAKHVIDSIATKNLWPMLRLYELPKFELMIENHTTTKARNAPIRNATLINDLAQESGCMNKMRNLSLYSL